MSDKYEQKILEWCSKSRTRNLEYLDLSQNQKISFSDLAINLEVTHNQVCFLSKAVLDQFAQITEENKRLQKEVRQLKTTVCNLEKEVFSQKPLSRKDLIEILRQPRVVDEEVAQTVKELSTEVKRLQRSVVEIKKLIGGG